MAFPRAVLVLFLVLLAAACEPVGRNERLISISPSSASENDRPASRQNNIWYKYDDTDTVFIFIHGVLSDSRNAWSYEHEHDPAKNTYWPALIAEDPKFEGVSIFLGGFYTEIGSAEYDIRDAANELYRSLAIPIDPAGKAVLETSNILFITHSTGGIVVRHMLTRHTQEFADKKVGLILIASPSMGSRDADRFGFITELARHKLGKQLRWNNSFLEELDKDFKDLVNDRSIPGLVGTEWLEHYLVYAKWLGIARDSVLVEEESAGRYFGAPIRLPGTDHISAVKPNDRSHPAYQQLRFFYEKKFLPAVGPTTAASELAQRTDLVLTMIKGGWPDAMSGGRVYEFTLSNPMQGVAIVESVSVEVIDVIEDHYPQLEAVLAKFKYLVKLQPDFRGRYTFAEGFKYASGDADQFTVRLDSSEPGYDYFFRFVVVWHDPSTNQRKESYSEVLVARYPSSSVFYEEGDEAIRRKFDEHNAKVWARQAEIAAILRRPSQDAQTEGRYTLTR